MSRQEAGRLGGLSNGRRNAAKTHCPHGHPYSGDNLYIVIVTNLPNRGWRQCRTCQRTRQRGRGQLLGVVLLSLVLIGGLGGCAQGLAYAITDAVYLHEAAGAYVREVHGLRQFIRKECQASLVREIEALKRAGDESALREMLAENYPELVTVDVLRQARDDPAGILSQAPGCE